MGDFIIENYTIFLSNPSICGKSPYFKQMFFEQKPKENYICAHAGVAQLVERQPSKLNVAGSNPVSRSSFYPQD